MIAKSCVLSLVLYLPLSVAAQKVEQPPLVETQHISLWKTENSASLDIFLPLVTRHAETIVLIVPGGGFGSLSPYDRMLAKFFRDEGYAAAVVNYRLLPAHYPAAVADVMRAIRLLRKNGPEWGIKAHFIALVGESAGGMLSAIVATQPDLISDPSDELADAVSAKPDLLVLICPVITAVATYRYRSVDRWLGENITQSFREKVSPELHVDASAPPAIMFHAADDPVVPYEGTLDLARAYWKAGAAAELHLYPNGGHGHAFYDSPAVHPSWTQETLAWLSRHSSRAPGQ